MIVATAGHIDHGKTLLVKALTGVDSDRLPEERARGMSIDLGFAYAPAADDSVLGFVDVPGHERFVRNMLAGVSGIDLALLVVAADDGPMPQTREHLAILDLLGVPAGAIAITKTDRVDPQRVAAVSAELAALVAGTALDGAPQFPVSAVSGEGIDRLRAHLHGLAGGSRTGQGRFRMSVDRRFTISGAGLVVTGTVLSGTVRPGDSLTLAPEGIAVRVRGLRAQDRDAEAGTVGQRCALNIAGPALRRAEVHRGQWLIDPAAQAPTARIDLRLRVLPSEPRSLKHWTPVHVHLGAADVPGRVAVLEGRAIDPGETGLAQLVLDRPVAAFHGDRLILRDQSATRTVAGGGVVDPFGAPRGRARPERLALLRALEQDDAGAALDAALPLAPGGFPLARFALGRGLSEAETAALAARPGVAASADGTLAFTAVAWAEALDAVTDTLGRWHDEKPDHPGPPLPALRQALDAPLPRALIEAAVADRVAAGLVSRGGTGLRLADFTPSLSPGDASLWRMIEPILTEGGRQPPVVHDMARGLGLDPERLRRFLRRATAFGLVRPVAENRFLLPGALRALADAAVALGKENPDGFDARSYRDAAGIGRNTAIQLLEFFDEAGLTRRDGDLRTVLKPREAIFP
jgi:selenocysteine-specific elongation factor